MTDGEEKWLKEVFRVRGIPGRANSHQDAAEYIAEAVGDLVAEDIRVYSLATTLDYWDEAVPKCATVQFRTMSPSLERRGEGEWVTTPASIILDTHFLGMTPLNDVDPSQHQFECIAISGLASHPFGSWQSRGSDKSFMWIRDEIPKSVPNTRVTIYGYNSKLLHSDSFQSIHDIAKVFFEHMRASWPGVPPRPFVFLAHSLGGIVLKDAIVQMANAHNKLDHGLLDKIEGAIMFGVPSLGMRQTHLLALVEGQPNETLIYDLSPESTYLRRLQESFSGIQLQRKFRIYWVFETVESKTLIQRDNTWVREGPTEVLVNRHSATCRLIDNPAGEAYTLPVDADHSNMVKFHRGHPSCRLIISRLRGMCKIQADSSSPQIDDTVGSASAPRGKTYIFKHLKNSKDDKQWKQKDTLFSLDDVSLDARSAAIEATFEHTFDWVFSHDQFVEWLQYGWGIFWVNGKPGSGKSTLIKFIFENSKTRDLMHDFNHNGRVSQVFAGFFFHFRGTQIQKSLEGVLRSLLKQLLTQQPALHQELLPLLPASKEPPNNLKTWSIPELERGLHLVLNQHRMRLEVVLFFDALDEFDGPPEVISKFLQSLVRYQDESYTRVKVCFSSRPWPIFFTHFESSPALSMQDHNRDDIRDYYIGSVANLPSVALDLTPDVVDIASGVFLWVRLVIPELATIISSSSTIPTLEELRTRLIELPKQLDEFYELIISRIAQVDRWKTYALLELLIRARGSKESSMEKSALGTLYLVKAVLISDCRTFLEAQQRLKSKHMPTFRDDSHLLSSWSGGLVEVNSVGVVQLMHQTVFEFVSSITFKQLVLGPRAKITHENGHSFHAKTMIMTLTTGGEKSTTSTSYIGDNWVIDLAWYASMAESTTGRTQWEYLERIPEEHFNMSRLNITALQTALKSIVDFAAVGGLVLWFQEFVTRNPDALKFSPGGLLFTALRGAISYDLPVDMQAMLSLFLKHQYPVHKDMSDVLHGILDQQNLVGPSDTLKKSRYREEIIPPLLEHVQRSGSSLKLKSKFGNDMTVTCYPLHIADPGSTASLLELGADVNARDEFGATPADWTFAPSLPEFKRYYEANTRFEKLCILVEAGATISQDLKDDLRLQLRQFEQEGFDTNLIRSKFKNPEDFSPTDIRHPRNSIWWQSAVEQPPDVPQEVENKEIKPEKDNKCCSLM